MKWYARQCEKLGYKYYVYPFKLFDAPFYSIWAKNYKEHKDALKDLKDLAGYDVIIHNVLSDVFVDFGEPSIIKEMLQNATPHIKNKMDGERLWLWLGKGLLFSEK